MSVPPNLSNTIPIQIPGGFFFSIEVEKLILKFIWKFKGPRIAKTNPKKNKTGGLTTFDF